MKLKAENLNIGYGDDKVVFRNISFAAAEGEMVALLGVNGIGKSTLLRTLSGLQKSVSGDITIGEKNLNDLPVQERARLISIVLTERIFVDNIRVKEFVALGRMPYTNWLGKLSDEDNAEVQRVISIMKIDKLAGKLFNELSDGEKQKVLIARALCQQTPVIILDEPTAFLDFRNKREILELLSSVAKDLNKIVILSTHDVEASLNYCSKCWIMTEDKAFVEIAKTDKFGEQVLQLLFNES
ncbi:MAG TPA: ABC transporter ATP-binding protein [Chitinophagales bacterium]|nr:ABC transporter ATP-binding protein [Chitinophagales bacterium]